eukprot:Sdes_comp20114_c0_seq1m13143
MVSSQKLENEIGKRFKVTADDRCREAFHFLNCKKCEIQIDFRFSDNLSISEGNKRWLEQKKQQDWLLGGTQAKESSLKKEEECFLEANQKQIFYFVNCSDCKITEICSLEAHFVFLNSKNCEFILKNS